ncbi:MAG: chaperone NapD [Gammaproteobacteria bacterium]|nr:chaperone NapD [Gammaproteobacteria bacterium]
MNISGVLVRSYPKNIQSVWNELSKIEGVEVHGSNDDGRMVVTVEQDDAGALSDMLVRIQDIHGVLSTSMIYHQFEETNFNDN